MTLKYASNLAIGYWLLAIGNFCALIRNNFTVSSFCALQEFCAGLFFCPELEALSCMN